MTDSIQDAIKCFQDEAQAILDLIPQLTSDFDKAIDLIYNCTGKFIVTGVGKSGHIGAKIAATLASTGTPSFFINPLDAYHGDLGMISRNDVVMAISYSGQTDELLRFLPLLIDRKIPIIGMSGNPNSLLAQYSDCHLNIAVKREACPLNLAPTSSTTATLAMGDAIACALINKRGFKPEDFAKYHPGGSLGRRLLSKVEDYMVKTNLPIVSPEAKASDAIFEISKNKQGIAVVIENSIIKGVVTDGDIRRAMQKNKDNFFSLTVNDLMSRNPKIINGKARLSEAEQLMRTNSIHSLIVVDEENRLAGIIDYFRTI
ncbi:MAG: KpsF/GutQ family sugar-phosphate isomerase [Bacteroidales bacterium]|nr:KpsF/GutQ family sugar-phosphate isomerase [Bacteroidales bacterium]